MLILKGILIGIGKIIPGVSGSMLAISLGIYEELINAINYFFKYPSKNFKFLFKVGIGVIIAIILFSNIILMCLDNYNLITIFFFIGLIAGGFDNFNKKIDLSLKGYIIMPLIIVILFGLINTNNNITIENPIYNFLYFIAIGFIDAITTIVPGISGTATLMMLGAYTRLMTSFSTMFDAYYLLDNLSILVPFLIGFVLGIILTARLISYLLKNYKSKTYNAIFGFSLATIIYMFIYCYNSFYTAKDIILGFIFLILGYFIVKKINRLLSID